MRVEVVSNEGNLVQNFHQLLVHYRDTLWVLPLDNMLANQLHLHLYLLHMDHNSVCHFPIGRHRMNSFHMTQQLYLMSIQHRSHSSSAVNLVHERAV
jgi:hypothetical protein